MGVRGVKLKFDKPEKRVKEPKRIKRGGPIARKSVLKKSKKRRRKLRTDTKKYVASLRKKIIKKADDVCRAVVRKRGACENCGSTHILQWAHGYSRKYLKTRWSTWFTFLLCARCHVYYTKRWEEWVDWMKKKLGLQLYEQMHRQALDKTPIETHEIEALIEKLEAELSTVSTGSITTLNRESDTTRQSSVDNTLANKEN